jgi:hypothetical protein
MGKLRDVKGIPSVVRGLLEEIEAATQTDVAVEKMNRPSRSAFTCVIGPDWPSTITVRFERNLEDTSRAAPRPYAAVHHELLHAKRYLVQRVPQVVGIEGMWRVGAPANVTDPEQLAGIASIAKDCSAFGLEAALEHIVIDGLVGAAFNCEVSRCDLAEWDAATLRGLPNDRMQRWGSMLQWFASEFSCTDREVKKRADWEMDRLGILSTTRELATWIRELIATCDPVEAKEQITFATCNVFGIPIPDLRLLYRTGSAPGFEIRQVRVVAE